MQNIEMTLEGRILTIKIDITKELGPSKTGKSILVATTEGNKSLPGVEGMKVGINVYKRA